MSDKLDRTDATAVLASLMVGNQYDGKRIDTTIRSIHARGKQLDAMVHATAVAVIHLSQPHIDGGHLDCSKATTLLAAMPKGGRSNALKAWFAEFSNIRFDKDGKAGLLKPTNKGYADARPQAAMAKPYWELVPEPAVLPFTDATLLSAIKALVNRVENAKEVTLSEDNVVLLDSFRNIVAKAA